MAVDARLFTVKLSITEPGDPEASLARMTRADIAVLDWTDNATSMLPSVPLAVGWNGAAHPKPSSMVYPPEPNACAGPKVVYKVSARVGSAYANSTINKTKPVRANLPTTCLLFAARAWLQRLMEFCQFKIKESIEK